MRKQKGQSAVEFALMAPIVFAVIFATIYGGIMFMDYLNFNNYARTIAREVSLAPTTSDRDYLVKKYNAKDEDLAGIYKVSVNVDYNDEDVNVEINFNRRNSFIVIPESFAINYRMRLENLVEEDT